MSDDAPDLAAMRAKGVAERSAADAADAVADLRRQSIAEAVEGMLFQGSAAIRFLATRDNGCAAAAMSRISTSQGKPLAR